MRYFAVGLVALLISVPAVAAAGGPDALTIARQALRLAKQPPKVVYVYSAQGKQSAGDTLIYARCPRGTKPMGVFPDATPSAAFVASSLASHNRAYGAFRSTGVPKPATGPQGPAITVACIEGR